MHHQDENFDGVVDVLVAGRQYGSKQVANSQNDRNKSQSRWIGKSCDSENQYWTISPTSILNVDGTMCTY